MKETSAILKVENLSKRFGGFEAVSGLSFSLVSDKIIGLVGPNGAGKTTTFNLISGFLKPNEGNVVFQGQDITGLAPSEIARKGLVRTFQLNKLFSNLSVEENIRIGCHLYEKGGMRRFLFGSRRVEEDEYTERVNQIINFIGLRKLTSKLAADLPYGAQKLLSIGVAVGTAPSLLMLDEPFAGMNETETAQCAELLRKIFNSGTGIFLVDHNMRAIREICDHVLVLNFGKKIAEGSPEEVEKNEDVITCYLGRRKNC